MIRFILFIFTVFIAPIAQAETVDGFRVGNHNDYARIVIDMTGKPDFTASIGDNPKNITITLPAKKLSIAAEPELKTPIISFDYKIISNDEYSVITLNIDSPQKIRNAFVLEGTNQNPTHRLVIDIQPTSNSIFQNNLDKKYGSLNITGEKTQDLESLLASISNDTRFMVSTLPIEKPYRKPIIVIDPGHGGQDPGAISPGGIQEKNITLPMAKTIAHILNASGRYDARLTRSKDYYIKLYNRVKIARNANADIFVSVHADSVGNHNTRGASIYTLSNTASDKQTAKLAARENRSDIIAGVDLGIEDPDVSKILLDLSMRETMNRSKSLANTIVGSFQNARIGTLKRPHRYAGFAVLKAPDVPSVLIETGFVSNEKEAKRLLSPEYQQQIGTAFLHSLDTYFNKK
jgi:N-acetylmuramoyl-L-alanine amidase